MFNARALVGLCLVATSSLLAADNSDSARTTEADQHLSDIANVLGALTELEEEALATNDTVRASCLRVHVISVTGLLEVSRTTRRRMNDAIEDEDPELVQTEFDKIRTAGDRAQKIMAVAGDCAVVSARQSHRPANKPPGTDKIKPLARDRPLWMKPSRSATRKPGDCLHQDELARFLVLAMGLPTDAEPVATLQARAIEPFGGWKPKSCANVEDLYVTTALALDLEVEDLDEPASYAQALRDFGLPVDTVLPQTVPHATQPAILLESEVKEFFSKGLAAPLHTSRPYTPR